MKSSLLISFAGFVRFLLQCRCQSIHSSCIFLTGLGRCPSNFSFFVTACLLPTPIMMKAKHRKVSVKGTPLTICFFITSLTMPCDEQQQQQQQQLQQQLQKQAKPTKRDARNVYDDADDDDDNDDLPYQDARAVRRYEGAGDEDDEDEDVDDDDEEGDDGDDDGNDVEDQLRVKSTCSL